MSRFNTPEEVKEYATKVAADYYRRHKEYGIDLNPFCTPGARNDWQRGFDNKGPRSYEVSIDFDTIYALGRATALLVEAEKNSERKDS